MTEEAQDPDRYELAMPFVACVSEGGSYEDRSFVAGYTAASIDARLKREAGAWQHYVAPDLLPQLDLIAMALGWVMTAQPWAEHPDEWALATFIKVEESRP